MCHYVSTMHICFLFLLSLFKFKLPFCMCHDFLFQLMVSQVGTLGSREGRNGMYLEAVGQLHLWNEK